MIEKEQTINEKFDSLTEKVSQQELVFNDMMIEKEQTINEKFDEHEQKLHNIVSVNLHSFCTKFNSILIELCIGRRYFSPEILFWTKRRFYSNPRIQLSISYRYIIRPFIC